MSKTDRLVGLDAYTRSVVLERERIYSTIVSSITSPVDQLRFLEIGAGHGFNVEFFKSIGFDEARMDLIEPDVERSAELRSKYATANTHAGTVVDAELNAHHDIILISLVLSSVLDQNERRKILEFALSHRSEDGHVICYDFSFNNPNNPKVKAVNPRALIELLPVELGYTLRRENLAPPIGRRMGSYVTIANKLFPFLRSHFILDIYQKT